MRVASRSRLAEMLHYLGGQSDGDAFLGRIRLGPPALPGLQGFRQPGERHGTPGILFRPFRVFIINQLGVGPLVHGALPRQAFILHQTVGRVSRVGQHLEVVPLSPGAA